MKITCIKTEKINPGHNNISSLLDKYIVSMPEKSVLVVTSKIVSITEGSIVDNNGINKQELVEKEAEYHLPPTSNKYRYALTIKHNILIPTAGIDESNGNGNFILWPRDPQTSANIIREYLTDRFARKNIGVVVTDSKTTPLRWGTTGVAISHSGFNALNDYLGKKDVFGRVMLASKANIMDSLAAAAVLCMGEGPEQTPLAIIEDLPFVEFQDRNPTQKELDDLHIDIKDDIYAALLNSVKWQKGNKEINL